MLQARRIAVLEEKLNLLQEAEGNYYLWVNYYLLNEFKLQKD